MLHRFSHKQSINTCSVVHHKNIYGTHLPGDGPPSAIMATYQDKSVSMERLEQILPAAYDSYQLLVPALNEMVHYRVETISQLNLIADALDKRHHTGNIVKVAGSATGTAGSAMAAAGAALTPFTGGLGVLLLSGGLVVAGLGSLTAFGAAVTEKVHEKVDLDKVQQAVDRDREQCQRVQELWKEFESYCDDAINTIALADPNEEPDIASIKTWVQAGMEVVKSPVIMVAEAFESLLSTLITEVGDLCGERGGILCDVLETAGRELAKIFPPNETFKSAVSRMKRNVFTAAGVVAFVLASGVMALNILVLVTTLIDMHNGSPSKVAKELRKTSSKLQKELNRWLDAFGKTPCSI